jgi:hypothetical protein
VAHRARRHASASPRLVAAEQADQRIEVRREQVLAPEVTDNPLFILAVLAVSLDQSDVLVLDAFAARSLDGA